MLNEIATLKGKYVAMKMIKTCLLIFSKNMGRILSKKFKKYVFDFLLIRNHGSELQILKKFLNFEPGYLLWPSLAYKLLWFF